MVRRVENYSELWKRANWKEFQKVLFRLQCRVWKAIRTGDMAKARKLQKLILKSHSARMLAIRQVTQLNQGKKTAGVDGKAKLTFKERFELASVLKESVNKWRHKKLREIPIPKKDGTKRILKVPTIADRAWQCLVKYALEPAHEAQFHARSYGFRTGRSAHDAQKFLFCNLRSSCNGKDKRVLELDIEKCFDRISHKAIIERVIAPQFIKQGLWLCLKAGVNPQFPEQGTPQGGVCSPLLANIALNGIEDLGKSVRYADDMVFILKPNEDAGKLLEKIETFLAERGMKISERKTKLTATTDGFDFLGWHFKVQSNGKFKITPSEENFKAFQQKVKKVVNSSNYGATEKADKLAPIVRGWRNYHRYCDMSSSRNSLWFMNHRAFKVFNQEKKQTKYSAEALVKKAFPKIGYKESKFIPVKGEKSPYDGDVIYWSQRNSRLYNGSTAKALKSQNHSCGRCKLKFIPGERIHLHHCDGNHGNWNKNNLLAIHESCHDYIHMSKSKS